MLLWQTFWQNFAWTCYNGESIGNSYKRVDESGEKWRTYETVGDRIRLFA